jgi:AcrR family transcriptional regulator
MKSDGPSARERLLNAAQVLFYNDGIGATGIDAIVERAGVAKKSLYNNFASKADLVNQYIEARHAEASTPKEGVLAVFDAYQDHAEFAYERGFRGCGLLNAAAELATGDAGRQAVRRHKQEVEAIIAGHLRRLLPDDRAATIAKHISFLLEGAMAMAGLDGTGANVATARAMASDMIDAL